MPEGANVIHHVMAKQFNQNNVTEINTIIRDMLYSAGLHINGSVISGHAKYTLDDWSDYPHLGQGCPGSHQPDSLMTNSYRTNYDAIRDLFSHSRVLTQMLIYQRLAILDSFYGTNVNRMRQFGLEEITDAIWNECKTPNGNYADSQLSDLAIDFVKNPNYKHRLKKLCDVVYGYTIDKKSNNCLKRQKATSLISKYLFFLVLASGDKMGFPIYDSIANKLTPKLAVYLGISKPGKVANIIDLTVIQKQLVSVLSKADPLLWNNGTMNHLEILDYFLWRIGKVGNLSFSLLLTKSELLQHSSNIANFVNPQSFAKMPKRFRIWNTIYHKII